MKNERNKQLLLPRPEASGLLIEQASAGNDERSARREKTRQANSRRNLLIGGTALSAMAVVAGASFAAGGGRPLAHNIDHAARDAFRNHTEAISDAFSGPTPVITGEPSNSEAAHTVQQNEAHNAAVAAAKAAREEAASQ